MKMKCNGKQSFYHYEGLLHIIRFEICFYEVNVRNDAIISYLSVRQIIWTAF